MLTCFSVNQAVDYITNQPDGMWISLGHAIRYHSRLTWFSSLDVTLKDVRMSKPVQKRVSMSAL